MFLSIPYTLARQPRTHTHTHAHTRGYVRHLCPLSTLPHTSITGGGDAHGEWAAATMTHTRAVDTDRCRLAAAVPWLHCSPAAQCDCAVPPCMSPIVSACTAARSEARLQSASARQPMDATRVNFLAAACSTSARSTTIAVRSTDSGLVPRRSCCARRKIHHRAAARPWRPARVPGR